MSRCHRVTLLLLAITCPTALLAQEGRPVRLQDVVVQGPESGAGARTVGTSNATGPVRNYVAKRSLTGTKTPTPLNETPQSISVVGAEQIRDTNAQSVVEATRYTAGVLSATFGNDTRNDWFLIRGFPGQISGYYLDGLQLYSNAFATYRIEPFGLERLEVLKGPASVLYGGSNTGGIINAVSKRPPEKTQGTIRTGVNNFGNAYAAFDVGGPVAPRPDNHFYYRIEGLVRRGGTQTDFTPDDRTYIAPSIAWRPDAATEVTVLGSYQKDRTRGQNFLPYVGTVQRASFGRIPTSLFTSDPQLDTFQRNQALIGYSASHRVNDSVTVRSNMRYSDLRIDFRTLYGNGYVTTPEAGDITRFNFNTLPHGTQLAIDNNIEARFRTGAIRHTGLLGIDYKYYTLNDRQGFAGGPSFNIFNPVYFTNTQAPAFGFVNNLQKQHQLGAYLQDQAQLDRFTLVLSGRSDNLRTSQDNFLPATTSPRSATNALTGRAGLIYTSAVGVAPYVTYATSFDPQLATNTATGGLLRPQTGQLTEVGAKYTPPQIPIQFNAALFYLVQQNVLTTNAALPIGVTQSGEQRSKGFELEAQGELTPGFKVLASYTGYNLRTTQDLNPAIVGLVPTNRPQNFGAMFLDYTIQTGALAGLGAGAGPRYQGASFADQLNQFGVRGYVLADAAVHFERGPYRVALNVLNVFDKTYVATCSTFNSCFYGDRRRATLSAAYSW